MIEIMIGVLLLALILIPSLNVIIGQAQTVTSTRDHAQAAFLAEKILEIARSYPFDMLEEERHNNDNDSSKKEKTFEYRLKNKEEYNTHVVNGITYKIDPKGVFIDPITTKNADKDSIPNICAVKFTIQYTGKDGRDHHLDIHTILAQR